MIAPTITRWPTAYPSPALAQFGDHANRLVPEDEPGTHRILTFHDVHVGAADGRGGNLMTASPARGRGRGTSSSLRSPTPWNTTACIVSIWSSLPPSRASSRRPYQCEHRNRDASQESRYPSRIPHWRRRTVARISVRLREIPCISCDLRDHIPAPVNRSPRSRQPRVNATVSARMITPPRVWASDLPSLEKATVTRPDLSASIDPLR